MKQKKPNEKPSKFAQEMMSESKSPQIANDEVVRFFIPVAVKRRGGSTMVILPKNHLKTKNINGVLKYYTQQVNMHHKQALR